MSAAIDSCWVVDGATAAKPLMGVLADDLFLGCPLVCLGTPIPSGPTETAVADFDYRRPSLAGMGLHAYRRSSVGGTVERRLGRPGGRRMGMQKYVALLDADHAVTPGEFDDVVGWLVDSAGGVAGLVGLTVSSLNEFLSGPAETIAAVQAWIDHSEDVDSAAVLAHLTGSVDATVSS